MPRDRKHRWQHQDGGCMVGTKDRYPCDDQYKDRVTGRIVSVRSTIAAHFQMPFSVAKISDLRKIRGVKV